MQFHFSDGSQPRGVPIALYRTAPRSIAGGLQFWAMAAARSMNVVLVLQLRRTLKRKNRMNKVLKMCLIVKETKSLVWFYPEVD